VIRSYVGPPPLTIHSALSAWTISIGALVAIAGLAASYLFGVSRLQRAGRNWPVGRTISFVGLGLGSFAVATMSFIGVYAHVLFWVYATQLVILLMVTPALLALGAPLTLAEVALPPGFGVRIASWPHSVVGWISTYPVFGTLLIAAVPFVVYFTPTFEYLMRHAVAYQFAQLGYVFVGFLFFWPLLSSDQQLRRWPWPLATLVVFVETLFDSIPGIVIWLSTRLLAPAYYAQVARPWGRSLLSDQKLGGVMLWAIGEVVGVPLLIAMVAQWMRADEREAARVDRALDDEAGDVPETLRSTARLAPTGEPTGEPDGEPDGETADEARLDTERPWWERDPDRLRRGRKFDWE
jgi:cytochrome c oxidase assembly factor CtaG